MITFKNYSIGTALHTDANEYVWFLQRNNVLTGIMILNEKETPNPGYTALDRTFDTCKCVYHVRYENVKALESFTFDCDKIFSIISSLMLC